MADTDNRTSIYIRAHLSALLGSGRVPAKTISKRLDRVVARYNVLVKESLPRRLELTPAELVLLADLVSATDLAEPDYALILPVKLQQMADRGESHGADAGGLAYRLRALKLGELLAVIDLVEQFIGEVDVVDRAAAKSFLAQRA
ncbi:MULTISPECIES: hypothetical protein [unclassified Rhodanobacter]|uniref:hypothetical protein n=1 Tax=unclassified Rhodanobacter TaxID=2621553 RepID=UPI0007AA0748|nr:hypothetical protein [Rhodanobacter sp. FW510-R10]KZC32640.1 hypothetical protein RhoFW510R10_12055 [Rhodanobacter sp. FW510-R10]